MRRHGPVPAAFVAALAMWINGCGDALRPDRNEAPDARVADSEAIRDLGEGGSPPRTEITFGPRDWWDPCVKYEWTGTDDDGEVVGFRYALSSVEEFLLDGQVDHGIVSEYFAWLDTLSYRPLPGGGQGPPLWIETTANSAEWTLSEISLPYLFAVRAIDDAGLEDPDLERFRNGNAFEVRKDLLGPSISLATDFGASRRSGEADRLVEIFAQGVEFRWSARPGQSGIPVGGYSYAIDDTTSWSSATLEATRFPEAQGELWYPEPGDHAFFVRAFNEQICDSPGSTLLTLRFRVFPGPRGCGGPRFVLVVLDTDVDHLQQVGILPAAYEEAERELVDYWLEGYDYRVHETLGEFAPPMDLMNCASSVLWFHSSDVDAGDGSVLLDNHVEDNVLQTYVASGGNFFLCGFRPANAIRLFRDPINPVPTMQTFPVSFESTLTDTTYLAHWAATHFGIERIEETVGTTPGGIDGPPLSTAVSTVRGRFNPYPHLEFDPATWPEGPIKGGFGLYDLGVIPRPGKAEVVYEANDTGIPVAVRWLRPPGEFGSTSYLGLHPYFVQRTQGRALVRAVLSDFGELRREGGVAPQERP